MEPWDGPASIAFTDGTVIGAVLDRNGLRPSRYYVTKDDMVIMASEVGVLDIPPENIAAQGAAAAGPDVPGRHGAGPHRRRRRDQARAGRRAAVSQWLDEHMIAIDELPAAPHLPRPDHETVLQRQQAFGYTHEDLRILLGADGDAGEEAVGSMGTDTPLAVLSDQPRLLYNYFKQLFAQVTNPPLDAIREELVTSMGPRSAPKATCSSRSQACRQIKIKSPMIDNEDLAKLRHLAQRLPIATLPMLSGRKAGAASSRRWTICAGRERAVADGSNILILSDRGVDQGAGADSRHAGDGGRASPPGPRRHAHALRAGRRIGRSARSASLRFAHRLRRRRDQSVPRVRNARRHDPPGHAAGHRSRQGRARTTSRRSTRAS